jgi:hypothetical protein
MEFPQGRATPGCTGRVWADPPRSQSAERSQMTCVPAKVQAIQDQPMERKKIPSARGATIFRRRSECTRTGYQRPHGYCGLPPMDSSGCVTRLSARARVYCHRHQHDGRCDFGQGSSPAGKSDGPVLGYREPEGAQDRSTYRMVDAKGTD